MNGKMLVFKYKPTLLHSLQNQLCLSHWNYSRNTMHMGAPKTRIWLSKHEGGRQEEINLICLQTCFPSLLKAEDLL